MSSPSSVISDTNENKEFQAAKRKWDNLFDNELHFVDDELDYEYSEDDHKIANEFPVTYSWSPASSPSSSNYSSPSSSRAESPERSVINLVDDDEESTAKKRTLKRITKNLGQICKVRRCSFSSIFRRNWKKNVDIKGVFKRWRIRSLDTIFIRHNSRYHVRSRMPQRVINMEPSPTQIDENTQPIDMTITVDNDKYSSNEKSLMSTPVKLRRLTAELDDCTQDIAAPPSGESSSTTETDSQDANGEFVNSLNDLDI